MYATIDFESKKVLKAAVKAGQRVTVYQPNDMFGAGDRVQTGTHRVTLEGPHYPRPHRWYAQAVVVDGIVTEVK